MTYGTSVACYTGLFFLNRAFPRLGYASPGATPYRLLCRLIEWSFSENRDVRKSFRSFQRRQHRDKVVREAPAIFVQQFSHTLVALRSNDQTCVMLFLDPID